MTRLSVLQWLTADDDETLYECRDCGRSFDDERASCPECGSENIAEYRL
ncbi:MAG: zinc ribbon domain-containing protein [Haloquadratum sp.]